MFMSPLSLPKNRTTRLLSVYVLKSSRPRPPANEVEAVGAQTSLVCYRICISIHRTYVKVSRFFFLLSLVLQQTRQQSSSGVRYRADSNPSLFLFPKSPCFLLPSPNPNSRLVLYSSGKCFSSPLPTL